ncbi:enhancer of split m5 protein-like [Teleopsis dalmanni]|uniref:Enhancer of split region protein HLHm5b n=1 Tax=Teleopsis dalmanni TaxID=139649 RepID=G9I1L9_TELDL|nr:enhancer of split m5 protein-like [Teleopsis dalmanni]AEV91207.1 enhancer of split region protein HLHm5b [Teleopsis dalmanni]
MSSKVVYRSKTEHYLKVKKPLIERQRRARMNKCLDTLKTLVAEFQADDAILRMDKAEMLETAITFMRSQTIQKPQNVTTTPSMDGYCNGYMNAVNEVSRFMAATPGMNVQIGKTVMTQLGFEFKRLQQNKSQLTAVCSSRPVSPASSGYHSDCDESSMSTPVEKPIWRPW